jgi:CheY-like chemotaxis protein
MLPDLKEFASTLHGKCILAVEDDIELAAAIASRLEQVTGQTVDVAHSMETALKRIDHESQPDLAIIDLMLPETETDLADISCLEKKARSYDQEIMRLEKKENDPEAMEILKGVRYERAMALKEVNRLVNAEGGIEMIRRWERSHPDLKWPIPTIFLTAISGDAERRQGQQVAGARSRWLVKGQPTETLLEICKELLIESTQF